MMKGPVTDWFSRAVRPKATSPPPASALTGRSENYPAASPPRTRVRFAAAAAAGGSQHRPKTAPEGRPPRKEDNTCRHRVSQIARSFGKAPEAETPTG